MPTFVPASAAMVRSDAPSTPSARKRARAARTRRGWMSVRGRAMSEELFPEAEGGEEDEREEEPGQPDELGAELVEGAPLEDDPAHDAQEMRQRQALGEPLGRPRHGLERE